MKDPDKLYITLLGNCSLSVGEKSVVYQNSSQKKLWMLLEYLIVNRGREIPQEKLIDYFYPEESSDNPVSALKTMVYRVRKMLDPLEFMDGRKIIGSSHGSYFWNTDMNFEVDTDRFEALCQEGRDADRPVEERLTALLAALETYKGDFLPNASLELWSASLVTFYHTQFIQAVYETLDLLKRLDRYEEIVSVCRHAVEIEPYDEQIYYQQILALYKLKYYQAAMARYKEVSNLLYSEFAVTPSKELTDLYKEIVRHSKNEELDLGTIKSDLNESTLTSGAYLCEYAVFKDIYRIEARAIKRTGQSIYLCLLTAQPITKAAPGDNAAEWQKTMSQVGDCIRRSLRQGDVYCRYSLSQYLLMLPLSYENGELVSKRIIDRFFKENPKATIRLYQSMEPVDPSQ